MNRGLVFLCSLAAGPALATCPTGETPVFSCLATSKEVQVCQGRDTVAYRYGRPGKPEITLSEKNAVFDWEHGEAPGAGTLDYLTFRNASTRYVITHQSGHDDPEGAVAHLTVIQGQKQHIIDCVSAIRFNPSAIKARPKQISEGTP